jgi:phage shock protein C
MQRAPLPLSRDDTLLGVCQALGEDFGFNPFYLRAALGVLLIVQPVAVILGYLGAAVAIALLRLIVPNPRSSADEAEAEANAARDAIHAEPEPMPLAA